MSSVAYEVSDSLKARGFNLHHVELMQATVFAGAEVTDENEQAMIPLREAWKPLLDMLPRICIEDKDGAERYKLDKESDAYKDFQKLAINMAQDRLATSPSYTVTFAKVPTPTGAVMWADISTLKDADGKAADIDPVKFRHFTTTGRMVLGRVKTDDADLMDQVILPIRKKLKGLASTTVSRLKAGYERRINGGSVVDPAKDFGKIAKMAGDQYKKNKEEEFPVGSEKELAAAIKQLRKVLGLGA